MSSHFLGNDSCGNSSALLRLANHAPLSNFQSPAQHTLHSYQVSEANSNISTQSTFNMKKMLSSLPKPQHVEWRYEMLHGQHQPMNSSNSTHVSSVFVNDFLHSQAKSSKRHAQPFFPSVVGPVSWNFNHFPSNAVMCLPMNVMPQIEPQTNLHAQTVIQDDVTMQTQEDQEKQSTGTSAEALAARNLIEDIHDVELEQTDFMNYMRHIASQPSTSAPEEDFVESSFDRMAMWDGYANWAKLAGVAENELDFLRMYTEDDDIQEATQSFPFFSNDARNNPLMDAEDPFALGQSLVRQGLLSDAIVAFEAAILQNPEHTKAWCELAVTYAENEQEDAALMAAERALKLSPVDCSSVLLSIARGHANSQQGQATLQALKEWLRCQPKYRHIVPNEHLPIDIDFLTSTQVSSSWVTQEELEEMENMLLEAARLPLTEDSSIDSQLQACLGIFYHLKSDFEKAVDCFETALHIEPNNALLWNKLGATLANKEEDEKAIHAYRRAIELAPGYVRARVNLSISCLSLGANRESLEHACTALQLQTRSRYVLVKVGDYSAPLWKTATIAARRIGDPELLRLTITRNLPKLLEYLRITTLPENDSSAK